MTTFDCLPLRTIAVGRTTGAAEISLDACLRRLPTRPPGPTSKTPVQGSIPRNRGRPLSFAPHGPRRNDVVETGRLRVAMRLRLAEEPCRDSEEPLSHPGRPCPSAAANRNECYLGCALRSPKVGAQAGDPAPRGSVRARLSCAVMLALTMASAWAQRLIRCCEDGASARMGRLVTDCLVARLLP